MRRLIQRLVYWFEVRLPRGAGLQLLVLLMLLGALALGAGLAAQRIQGSSEPSESVWWAFLRLTDTGYMGSDQGTLVRAISVLLSLGGHLLLYGGVVAILTTGLDRYLKSLDQGRGRIVEDGHFVILGWNERIITLVEELWHASRRLGKSRPCIAILAEKAGREELAELKRRLPPEIRRGSRLLLRVGSPLDEASLRRVDCDHARSIIVVAEDLGRHSDMLVAKIVLSLKTCNPQPRETLRAAVVEVHALANKALAQSVGWPERTRAVVSLEIVGRLLAQSIRLPGIAVVYRHLLTDSYGESLYFASPKELVGSSLGQLQGIFPQAIPVGILKAQKPLQLADLEAVLEVGDRLVLLASDPAACQVRSQAGPVAGASSGPARPDPGSREPRSLLIFGWGATVATLLSELATFGRQSWSVQLVCELDEATVRERLQPPAGLELQVVRQAIHCQEDLCRLRPQLFDNLVILSQDALPPLEADAESIMLCVLLERILGEAGPPILVELNEEDNQALLSSRHDLLVTDKIVSHLLAQVAVEPELLSVYEDLFTSGGAEISVGQLTEYVAEGQQTSFAACQEAALRKGQIAIGWRLEKQGLALNPQRELKILPGRTDHLITIAYEEVAAP